MRRLLGSGFFGAIVWATFFLPATSEAWDEEGEATLPPPVDRKVDFVADIQPIFRTACLNCHGPQLKESGYRLDVKQIALKGGDSYAPNIIPGKSADSPLIQFVAGLVEGMEMPAKGSPLTNDQIALLRAWIDQGAVWPDSASAAEEDDLDWWSLRPLESVRIPEVRPGCRNPIDAFIRAKLAEKGLAAAPEADRRTLIRRLYFDLIGLPPTPEEVDAFVGASSPTAYEELVDRLLNSPRYGERWARHWLDTVHFAESHGHDQDRIRENAWPYRDYLIESLNADKSYSRFVQEQVAADALFPQDPRSTAALGFLAAGPWDESSLRDIREDTIDRQIARYLDRDDMLATVLNNVTSVSVQCARCHDHKFDPVSQEDYYSLQAVFSGVERANRMYDRDLETARRRQALAARKVFLSSGDDVTRRHLLSPEIQAKVAEWEQSVASHLVKWTVVRPESWKATHGTTLNPLSDGSLLASGTRPDGDTYVITIPLSQVPVTAIRLEVLADSTLPRRGPGRQDNGNLHLSEIEVYLDEQQQRRVEIVHASSDFDQEGWGVAMAIDGKIPTAWGIFPKVGQSHQAVFEFKEPIADPNAKLTVVLKQLHGASHLIGRPRLAITSASPPAATNTLPDAIAGILSTPSSQRSEAQRVALALFHQQDEVARGLAKLPRPSYIYAAASDFEPDGNLKPPPGPRPVHVLRRGDIRLPLSEASPGALSCITGLPARFEIPSNLPESARRAALAKWLTDRRNPLTWRSIVNRVWHHHFGRGLVATPNDFGRMGALPSHPELLDWLAIEFRDNGQSLKDLHRLIVCSATYRQSCSPSHELKGDTTAAGSDGDSSLATSDVENQLLSRMNRLRLDAECVRDAILAISDQLDLRMGGPSDRHFEIKPGRHVTPNVDYGAFDWSSSVGRRRSVYRFLLRTLPDPFMESLDCPAGDQMTPVRANTVTVQQSLAMWNDAFVLRHCENLAARVDTMSDSTAGKIQAVFRLALSREPSAEELADFSTYAGQHGLANACRLILNSNEFVFVN